MSGWKSSPSAAQSAVERPLGVAHQVLEAHPVLALGRHPGQELEDVLVAGQPDQLGQLAAARSGCSRRKKIWSSLASSKERIMP